MSPRCDHARDSYSFSGLVLWVSLFRPFPPSDFRFLSIALFFFFFFPQLSFTFSHLNFCHIFQNFPPPLLSYLEIFNTIFFFTFTTSIISAPNLDTWYFPFILTRHALPRSPVLSFLHLHDAYPLCFVFFFAQITFYTLDCSTAASLVWLSKLSRFLPRPINRSGLLFFVFQGHIILLKS